MNIARRFGDNRTRELKSYKTEYICTYSFILHRKRHILGKDDDPGLYYTM